LELAHGVRRASESASQQVSQKQSSKIEKPPLCRLFPQVDAQAANDEPLFLKEKRRQQYFSIRLSGNKTDGGFLFCCSISSLAIWVG
jgi:hypothetical protein